MNSNDNQKNHSYDSYIVLIDNKSKTETSYLEAIKSLYKTALDLRNFEISQLVQRNNFFMICQGVMLAGVVQSAHGIPVVSFLVCLAGFVIAIFQVGMASGAKFWQDYWQEKLRKIETELISGLKKTDERNKFFQLFHKDKYEYEKMVSKQLGYQCNTFVGKLILKKYSVSQIPIYVALGLCIVWALLVLCTLKSHPPLSVPSFIVGFLR